MDEIAYDGARIGVVVVHYGTDDLTLRCLYSLLADDISPATRVVVVDNGPGAGIAERLRRELPEVAVVAPGHNTGFAGGCNRGIAALTDCDLVALVNSDAFVTPGWLGPLVAALDADPGLGAVVPKMRFEGRFHTLELTATQTWRPGRGDGRQLAWQPQAVEVAGEDVTSRCRLVEGFWEPGRGGRWAGERSVLRIPALDGATRARLRTATPRGRTVELQVTGGGSVALRGDDNWTEVPLADAPEPVLNNVGNERRADGYGLDRGFDEIDRGQHDRAGEVPAWCGGAVLLRRAYLDDVGPFDERLFLYYEDLELSLRGAARGWRYRYEPTSVVQHRHSASTRADTAASEVLKERNRLLVLARHGRPGLLGAELVRFVAVTLSYARRDIAAPLLRGMAPSGWLVRVRLRALAGALVRLPVMLASRRRDRARPGMPPLV